MTFCRTRTWNVTVNVSPGPISPFHSACAAVKVQFPVEAVHDPGIEVNSTGSNASNSGLLGSFRWNPSPEFLDFTSTVRTFPPPIQTSAPLALMVMSFCMNFAPGGGLMVTTEVLLLLLPVGSVVPETTVATLLNGPTGKVKGT